MAYLGLFLGVLPARIVAHFMQKRARGSLPMAEAPFRLLQRNRRIRVAIGFAIVASVVALVTGALMKDDAVILAGTVRTMTTLLAWLFVRAKAPRCRKIEGDYVVLDLPSTEAVQVIEAALAGEGAALPPVDAPCPRHEDAMATAVCRRCGDFTCASCACHARHTAPAFCPACYERRMQEVDLTPGVDVALTDVQRFRVCSAVSGDWAHARCESADWDGARTDLAVHIP